MEYTGAGRNISNYITGGIENDSFNWIILAQVRLQWSYFVKIVMNIHVRNMKLFDQSVTTKC
jgi:hypothetical protein